VHELTGRENQKIRDLERDRVCAPHGCKNSDRWPKVAYLQAGTEFMHPTRPSWCRRRRFCAGIASWWRAAGRIRVVGPAVRRRRSRCVSWCCGWRGRIRAGGTGASRANCSGWASRSLPAPSGKSSGARGSSRRRGGSNPAGRSSYADRRRIIECDFLTVDTVFVKRFYILFLIELASRRVHLAGVTANLDNARVAQQARNLIMRLDDQGVPVRFLIPRSRQQVHARLRRGLPLRRHRRDQDAGTGAASASARRALGRQRAPRMPRPDADRRPPSSRACPQRLRAALQHAPAAPGAQPAATARETTTGRRTGTERRTAAARSPPPSRPARRTAARIRTRRVASRTTRRPRAEAVGTCSWWCSTRISISFDRSERSRGATSSRRRNVQYENERATRNHPSVVRDGRAYAPCDTQRDLVLARARQAQIGDGKPGGTPRRSFRHPHARTAPLSVREHVQMREHVLRQPRSAD
jgi:hypothetical protein